MKIIGIIPARYESTRFPGKPLADIKGKTMIQRVYEQAKKSNLLDVYVATDDDRIAKEIERFNGNVILTHVNHPSGTDRIAEASEKIELEHDFIINIQGDEPFISPDTINDLIAHVNSKTEIITCIKELKDVEAILNPNQVKVVINNNKEALYFSRSPIPFNRNESEKENWLKSNIYYGHIGMYGYRFDLLQKITKMNTSTLENVESLEQLRWLENGLKIKTVLTNSKSIGIDTPKDLERALKVYF